MATVMPESTTERPAVSTALTTAVVVVRAPGSFLSPAGDQQQRVVDGDAKADQRDQELDDERNLGQVGKAEHDQQGGEDGNGRYHQRDEGEEGGEHERQHQQRSGGADERLGEDPRPV